MTEQIQKLNGKPQEKSLQEILHSNIESSIHIPEKHKNDELEQNPQDDLKLTPILKNILDNVRDKTLEEILEKSQIKGYDIQRSFIQKNNVAESTILNVLLQGVYDSMIRNHIDIAEIDNDISQRFIQVSKRHIQNNQEDIKTETSTDEKQANILLNQDFVNKKEKNVHLKKSPNHEDIVETVTDDFFHNFDGVDLENENIIAPNQTPDFIQKTLVHLICVELVEKVTTQEVRPDNNLLITFSVPRSKRQESIFQGEKLQKSITEDQNTSPLELKNNQQLIDPNESPSNSQKLARSYERLSLIPYSGKRSTLLENSSGTFGNKSQINDKEFEKMQKLQAEIAILRSQLTKTQETETDNLMLIQGLKNQLETANEKLLHENEFIRCENEDLRTEIDVKKKECENLRLNLKKINLDSIRSKQNNNLLKQSSKETEGFLKNLERKIKENEENFRHKEIDLNSRIERAEKFACFLIKKLEIIEQEKELLWHLNNTTFVKIILANYEQLPNKLLVPFLFQEKMLQPSDLAENGNQNYSIEDFGENDKNQKNSFEQHLDKKLEFGSLINEFDTGTLNSGNEKTKIGSNIAVNRIKNDFQSNTTPNTHFEQKFASVDRSLMIQNIIDSTNHEKSDPSKKNSFCTNLDSKNPSNFGTNKDEIRKQLDSMIKLKTAFKTSGTTDKVIFQQKEKQNESILSGESGFFGPSEKKTNLLSGKTIVTEALFFELIDNLEKYLESSKNETTFRISDFEKKVLKVKFQSGTEQNLRKIFMRTAKVFVKNINFLECQINKLVNSNSTLEMKYSKVKHELDALLQKYLAINQNSQQVLNENNEQVLKFRTNNLNNNKNSTQLIPLPKKD